MSQYTLNIDNGNAKNMASLWLKLGVFSLGAAGILAILLALSRTPGIKDIIPFVDFFHIALVVHVDLSVLIWFLSFAGVLWSLVAVRKVTLVDRVALLLAVLGTAMIVIAPFIGIGNPLMNNYVPVLDHEFFISGLAIFGLGITVLCLRTLCSFRRSVSVLEFAAHLAALTTIIAGMCLVISYLGIDPYWSGKDFYEMLFWGGGHVLQFTHTIFMLVAWMWLVSAMGAKMQLSRKWGIVLFALVALPVLQAIPIYARYDIVSAEHREAFTQMMRHGGLLCMPLGLLVAFKFIRLDRKNIEKKYLYSCLLSSAILFAAGGIIGFLIDGINVVIPAHYHGSIVGVTLSFMGLTYLLLPKFGFGTPDAKLAYIQPYIYGGGQLLHIIGLAWSGGYGVQRKTAGADQVLTSFAEKAGMGLMGLGGLISIIGGVLFLIVAIKSFRNR